MSVKLQLQNKIINGCFDFWQRGTSFTNVANGAYTCDRFRYDKSGTMTYNSSRSTDTPANAFGQFSLLTTVTTAQVALGTGSFSDIRHIIEGNVLRTFKNKKVVFSFWVKSSKTGEFAVSLRNEAATRSYVAPYNIEQANTWEKKTIRLTQDDTGVWNYAAGSGLVVRWALGYGASFHTSTVNEWQNGNFVTSATNVNLFDTVGATFQLADVILVEDNEGQTRDPDFMYAGRDYMEELQLCYRYFYKTFPLNTAPANLTGGAGAIQTLAQAANIIEATWHFLVEMRVTPQVVAYGVNLNSTNWENNPGPTTSSFTAVSSKKLNIRGSGNIGAGNVTSIHATADAEL